MALLSWCFDWNLIGSACLYNPIWLQINQDIGIIFTYILMTGVYYGNIWNAKQFPFMSQAIFVRPSLTPFSQKDLPLFLGPKRQPIQPNSAFDERQIRPGQVRAARGTFDVHKPPQGNSNAVSFQPAFFSATNALYLITSNLSLGAVLTHVILWHWDDLKPFFRSFNPWNRTPLVVHDPVCTFLYCMPSIRLRMTSFVALRENQGLQADPPLVVLCRARCCVRNRSS